MGKKQPYKLEKSVSTLSTLVRVIWVVGPCYESIIKFPHGLAREKSYTPKFVTFLPFLFVTANRTFALNRNLRIRQQHLTPLLYFILLNWPHCFIWSWHYGCHLFFVRWIFLLWIITFVLESPMSFLRKYRKKVQIVNIRETEIKLKWNWRNQKKKKKKSTIFQLVWTTGQQCYMAWTNHLPPLYLSTYLTQFLLKTHFTPSITKLINN